MLQTLVKHSTSLNYSKILCWCKLRLCGSQKMGHWRQKSSVMHDLMNLNEKAIKRKTIDPRVEKWKDMLLYSDYIQRKSLKFGYSVNKRIESQMDRKANLLKTQKLMTTPAFSVTLENDDDNQHLVEEEMEDLSSEVQEEASKPIYMPYAAKDSFKKIPIPKIKPKVEDNKPVLNEKFKVLYEKYLETMESTEQNNEELKSKLCVRLGDDLSKVPSNWMTDYETFDDKFEDDSWEAYYGTPNPDSDVSSIACGGCGALLHCKDSEIPGYLPSELFENQNKQVLQSLICQRCHFMRFYNTALDVKVSPEDYPKLLSVIKEKKCAVILMVDITDFPSSIWPNISSIIGRWTPIFVVGNKIDLLPQDSPTFLKHVTECLRNEVLKTGIQERNLKHVTLISAKSGFGIEEFINKLQYLWRYKGDVYLVGCTNVGKSSLFNMLLQSDYCKVKAADLIQRATTSPWPGTTLNLLKFPLTNPQPWRAYMRTQRLQSESESKYMEEKLRRHQFNVSRNILFATLQGRIGKTFRVPVKRGVREEFSMGSHRLVTKNQFGINENSDDFKLSKWCYDTPGSIQPDQILHFLTTDELMMTLPNRIIIPRTFVIHEGHTLFLAGIGRIDFRIVPTFLRCTVFSSHKLPLTICETIYADDVYRELLHTKAFGVPVNKSERLKLWPKLSSKEMEVTGISEEESAADVVLSSAGWVSLTPPQDEQVSVTAWTPEGRGLFLRTPALLSKSVNLRGPRISNSPAYRRGKGVYVKHVHI